MKKLIRFGEHVEGYDIPVLNEREIRASAGILFLATFISLMMILFKNNFVLIKYVVTLFLGDFLVRVFINPKFSPTLIIGRLIVGNQVPEYVGARQKKFAWQIGVVLSATMFILMVIVNSYSPITGVVCLVCLIFLFFESAFGICLGCKFYSLIYKEKAQYCPGEICDRKSKQDIQKTSLAQLLIVLAFIGFVFLAAFFFNNIFMKQPYSLFGIFASTLKMKEQINFKKLRLTSVQQIPTLHPVTTADYTFPPLRINLLQQSAGTIEDEQGGIDSDKEESLEKYFSRFREKIVGNKQVFESAFGEKEIVYADWTASGRAYQPIEDCMQKEIMPFLGNTHTETTVTGTLMSTAYETAKVIIKKHVNACNDDALVFCGSGTTAAVNKLQRILGLRIPERITEYQKHGANLEIDKAMRPIVFVTEMEHHSNQVSWLETIATVEIIKCGNNGNVDLKHFHCLLEKFKHHKNKIAAVTGCSNVTGIQTPVHEIAKLVHQYDGLCFVDFACSAPYINMDMHPAERGSHLDAIYFSPHKFIGGAGTPGVLIFNKKIYKNTVPDQPGGGTIEYSNPWRVHEFVADVEQREDGGTPPILQGIKAAMCVRLKEEMGVENILRREEEILDFVFTRFSKMKNVQVLAGDIKKRLGVVSFIIEGAHYNLAVKILNDRFGIQTRGGCSCAGTYGHQLLNVSSAESYEILHAIRSGNLSHKPGWIRLSLHPTMSNAEIAFIMDAIELTASNFMDWSKDYSYDAKSNEYIFNGFEQKEQKKVDQWFNVSGWNRSDV